MKKLEISKRFFPSNKALIGPKRLNGQRAEVQAEARKEFANNLATGRYLLEQRSCPLCCSENCHQVASVERHYIAMSTVLCDDCGLLYANPVLNDASLMDFYTHLYRRLYGGERDGGEMLNPKKGLKRAQRFFGWIDQNLLKEKVNKGTDLILEVGSGSGRHISVLSEAGYFAIGVDLDEKYMAAGKASGLDLRCGTLETVELPKAPKVIFYHHVFEHIADAKSELDRAWRRLENGGYLVIAVPGIRYYGKVYGRDFIKYLQIAHTQNYSLHTLSVLLASEGFQLVHGNETVRAIYQKVAKTETTQKSNSKNSAWGLAERESVLWHIRNEEQLFSEGKVETKGRNKRSKSSVSRSVMKLKRLLQGL